MLRKNKEPQRKWRSIEAHTLMQFWPRQKHCLGACVRHREKWRTQSSLQARNEHAVQGEVEKDVQDGTAPYSEVFCKLTTAQQFKSANRAISVQTGRPWSHLIFNLARSLRTATNPRSCTRGKQTWRMATKRDTCTLCVYFCCDYQQKLSIESLHVKPMLLTPMASFYTPFKSHTTSGK